MKGYKVKARVTIEAEVWFHMTENNTLEDVVLNGQSLAVQQITQAVREANDGTLQSITVTGSSLQSIEVSTPVVEP